MNLTQTGFKYTLLSLFFAVLCLAATFLTTDLFVESELSSKSYVFILGVLIYSTYILFSFRKVSLALDKLAFFVIIFIGYVWGSMLINRYFGINNLLIVTFAISYLVFRMIGGMYSQVLPRLIVLTCGLLAIYGLIQYLTGTTSQDSFRIVGSFDNPAGVAACLCCGFPFCFELLRQKTMKWMAIIALPIIITVVVLSGSRAGMIAITISTIIHLMATYRSYIEHYRFIAGAVLMVILFCCAGLFFLKKESAFGRILIWTVSCQMIKEAPFVGHGPGAFQSEYMSYQSKYFKGNPNSQYAQLADNVTHPFNEYLLLTVEYGTLGLLLLIACGGIMVLCRVAISPCLLSIITIAIFACFSYPLRYAFVLFVLSYALSQIYCGKVCEIKLNYKLKISLLLCLSAISLFLIRDIIFEMQWHKLTRSWSVGHRNIVQCYEPLYQKWNHNPLFLYNYGAVLNRGGYFSESLDIMKECEKYLNDYDVQMIKGDNYYNLQHFQEAHMAYSEAALMCPNRFIPPYRLFCICKAENRMEQAYEIALQLIKKPIKVQSGTVQQIIREMNDYISEYRKIQNRKEK